MVWALRDRVLHLSSSVICKTGSSLAAESHTNPTDLGSGALTRGRESAHGPRAAAGGSSCIFRATVVIAACVALILCVSGLFRGGSVTVAEESCFKFLHELGEIESSLVLARPFASESWHALRRAVPSDGVPEGSPEDEQCPADFCPKRPNLLRNASGEIAQHFMHRARLNLGDLS